ncbi:SA1362 family protein [Bacillus infantis]|uniref:SA1362 family protein n=1 Tax=Bacillus infantis TaxID=324767 RepID=UPI00296FCA6E|nr:SA1362 family protein [Bacillus infantis]
MAFLNNRTSLYIVAGLIGLAIIGIIGRLVNDPAGFLQSIAVIALIGAAVYFLFRRFYKAGPMKKEQQAFVKAAKKSKRKYQKEPASTRKASVGSLTSLRKTKARKSPPHLTVIDGKKGKKKNRATL